MSADVPGPRHAGVPAMLTEVFIQLRVRMRRRRNGETDFATCLLSPLFIRCAKAYPGHEDNTVLATVKRVNAVTGSTKGGPQIVVGRDRRGHHDHAVHAFGLRLRGSAQDHVRSRTLANHIDFVRWMSTSVQGNLLRQAVGILDLRLVI